MALGLCCGHWARSHRIIIEKPKFEGTLEIVCLSFCWKGSLGEIIEPFVQSCLKNCQWCCLCHLLRKVVRVNNFSDCKKTCFLYYHVLPYTSWFVLGKSTSPWVGWQRPRPVTCLPRLQAFHWPEPERAERWTYPESIQTVSNETIQTRFSKSPV